MSVLQKEIYRMIYVLPDKSLSSLKPVIDELLTSAVLLIDPLANITEMDELDKALFLQAVKKMNAEDYISFEDALIECGVGLDEI
ncbi:MAG: hypothetical protein LBR83_04655 [Clostridiales bacterium]|nr:hypothetical protein [Clostridiales bacterium]